VLATNANINLLRRDGEKAHRSTRRSLAMRFPSCCTWTTATRSRPARTASTTGSPP
jgi:hypothetical protein